MGLMPVLPQASHRSRPIREDHARAPDRQRSLHPCQGRPRQERSPSSATRIIGAAIFRSIAGSIISTRSASTIIATAARCSRRSSRAWSACATRTTRRAGRKATTSPRSRDGRVVKEELPLETPGRHVGARLQHAAPVVRRSARARGADQAVRFRMGEPHALSRPIRAHAKAISRARSSARMDSRPTPTERELLAPFADAVKPAIMDGSFAFPVSDGTGENREGRREALTAARSRPDISLNDGKLVNAATGEPFSIRDSRRHPRPGAAPAHLCAALKQVGIEAQNPSS